MLLFCAERKKKVKGSKPGRQGNTVLQLLGNGGRHATGGSATVTKTTVQEKS